MSYSRIYSCQSYLNIAKNSNNLTGPYLAAYIFVMLVLESFSCMHVCELIVVVCFTFFFFFGHPAIEFLGQGSDLSCSCGKVIIHCAGPGISPVSQHSQDAADPATPQWEV